MRLNEYQDAALRTKPTYLRPNDQITNSALGLAGEAGEFSDLIKKHLFQEHPLNPDDVVSELGDILWYVALAADALGVPLEAVAQNNIAKLFRRYPIKFDPVLSLNRKD